jgi:hypothetical protein
MRSRLLSLPREIRDSIYTYLIPTVLGIRPRRTTTPGHTSVPFAPTATGGVNWHYYIDFCEDTVTVKAVHNVNKQVRREWRQMLRKYPISVAIDLSCCEDPLLGYPYNLQLDNDPTIRQLTKAFGSFVSLRIHDVHLVEMSRLFHPQTQPFLLSAETILDWSGREPFIVVDPNVLQRGRHELTSSWDYTAMSFLDRRICKAKEELRSTILGPGRKARRNVWDVCRSFAYLLDHSRENSGLDTLRLVEQHTARQTYIWPAWNPL